MGGRLRWEHERFSASFHWTEGPAQTLESDSCDVIDSRRVFQELKVLWPVDSGKLVMLSRSMALGRRLPDPREGRVCLDENLRPD
jgi:hypothetical protein